MDNTFTFGGVEVGVFINAGVNRVLDGKDYKAINPQQSPGGEASHHPCDPEDH